MDCWRWRWWHVAGRVEGCRCFFEARLAGSSGVGSVAMRAEPGLEAWEAGRECRCVVKAVHARLRLLARRLGDPGSPSEGKLVDYERIRVDDWNPASWPRRRGSEGTVVWGAFCLA